MITFFGVGTGGNTYSNPNGIAVLRGNKGVGKAIGGAAAPTATLAPVPLNTPSVKRENNGRDPSVNLVPPRNAGVWGGQSGNSATDEQTSEARSSAQATAALTKPAPWAKPTTSAPNETTTDSAAAASKPMPSLRPQTANWADVDVDSDEDDNGPVTSAVGSANHALGGNQSTAAPAYSFNNSFSNNNSDAVRKDRSGSFNNDSIGHDQQRRFGGFGQTGSYPAQEEAFGGRFNNHNNNNRAFNSGDARMNGQNDFGVPIA